MKFTVCAIVIGLCFVLAQAGTNIEPVSFESLEYVEGSFANDLIEPEPEVASLFGGIYWILKGALKTVTGLKCTLKEVNSILTASLAFTSAVKDCGGEVSTQVQNLVTSVNGIISTSKAFSTLNETYCLKESDNHSGWNCFWKMLGQSLKLTNQIQKALKLMINLPKSTTGTSTCINSAVYALHYNYSQFPVNVKSCQKF